MSRPKPETEGCVAYVPTRRERKGLPPVYGQKAREKKSTLEIFRRRGWPKVRRVPR